MSRTLAIGDHIEHATLGRGKIVHVDETIAHVYFRDDGHPIPEKRVRQFRPVAWPLLAPTAPLPDPILDGLPPWNGSKFERPKTDLTIADAKRTFLRLFDRGIDDPAYLANELAYKRAAHQRFVKLFAPNVDAWIAANDATAIAEGIDVVWGRHVPSKERLNLLYHMGEAPAYFDALRSGGELTVRYAQAAIDVIKGGGLDALDRLIKALEAFPTPDGGTDIAKWPTLTWLPFIAAPDRFIVVRPTIIQAFASAYPRDLRFEPKLDVGTYIRVGIFIDEFRRVLQASEVNLAGRKLDNMDVQSFMWTVARYTDATANEARQALTK